MKKYKLSDILAWDSVKRAVKHYGIEGTEQIIKKCYLRQPIIKATLLKMWNNLYKKE